MSHLDNLPSADLQVIIRPAVASDRAAIAYVAETADPTAAGQAHLTHRIDEWLAHTTGEFFVAEARAETSVRVIGLGKLTCLAPDEWWLEGLRVDPEFYSIGVSRALHRYGLQRLAHLARGVSGIIRFATDDDNKAVHKFATETGFSIVASFRHYAASAIAMTNRHAERWAAEFRALRNEDLPALRYFLERSTHYAEAQNGVFGGNWQAHMITPARLQTWLDEKAVLGWFDGEKLRGVAIISVSLVPVTDAEGTEGTPQLELRYLDALPGLLASMARSVRAFAAHLGYASVRYILPVVPDRLVAMEQSGWRIPENDIGRILLFSRPLQTASDEVDP